MVPQITTIVNTLIASMNREYNIIHPELQTVFAKVRLANFRPIRDQTELLLIPIERVFFPRNVIWI